jgi:hypothetical protein
MIKFFRELLYNFLLVNKSLKMSGLSLEQAIIGDSDSLVNYCENIVRKMGEEARSILIPLLPSILRIKMYTVVLDTHDTTSVHPSYYLSLTMSTLKIVMRMLSHPLILVLI